MLELATLGAGCFWCIDVIFQQLKGVIKVEVGYSGGHIENPSYNDVCSETTGHAEVIQINFDPERISFEDLLDVFFTVHDPTQLNRQGNDIGTQYRSIILYHTEEQKRIAEKMKIKYDEIWEKEIVTDISSFDKLFIADDYHQNYYNLNSNQPYCKAIIKPKISKFRKLYLDKLKE